MKEITYIHHLAFFNCDCGKLVVACTINNILYKGECKCGINWEIKNKMIRSLNNSVLCPK